VIASSSPPPAWSLTRGSADCTEKIAGQLFRTGSEKGLDTSCLDSVKIAPFRLPNDAPPS
jgi:hypothetical protein